MCQSEECSIGPANPASAANDSDTDDRAVVDDVVRPARQPWAGRSVVVVVGAGGVGKTTLSAALGVAAACEGRRALVLTVDPARRLANALGLKSLDENVQTLGVEAFARHGCTVAVPLDVAMLDVKSTFDRVVRRYASSEARAEAIMASPFYRTASTALAGTQEYMAMVRLYEVVLEGGYDVVILDTPPSAHALDFLDAPRRMIELFGSRTFRILLKPFSTGGSVASGVFSPNSLIMRGIGRFTSVEAFSDLLGFFAALSDTFDGFVERARDIVALLNSEAAGFVVVSSPDDNARQEAKFLLDRLVAERFHVDAWLVNRVSELRILPADATATLTALAVAVGAVNTPVDDAALGALCARAAAMSALATADRGQIAAVIRESPPHLPVRTLPRRAEEPADLGELHGLAQHLLTAPNEPR